MWHLAATDVRDGMSAVGESRCRIPQALRGANAARIPTNHLDVEALSLLVGPGNEPKSWLEVEFAGKGAAAWGR